MRYLKLSEILLLHKRISELHNTLVTLRDLNALESAVAQPKATFGKKDLYLTIYEKASALCYSLIQNHPFVDGNKRVGHAAMETFLLLNGYEIISDIDEQEALILNIASGKINREFLAVWIESHTKQK
jgi:death on curing protein